MTAKQFQKFVTWTPAISDCLSSDFAARSAAEKCGLNWFRSAGRVVVECSDAIVELYWMNRAHTCLGVREAAC